MTNEEIEDGLVSDLLEDPEFSEGNNVYGLWTWGFVAIATIWLCKCW